MPELGRKCRLEYWLKVLSNLAKFQQGKFNVFYPSWRLSLQKVFYRETTWKTLCRKLAMLLPRRISATISRLRSTKTRNEVATNASDSVWISSAMTVAIPWNFARQILFPSLTRKHQPPSSVIVESPQDTCLLLQATIVHPTIPFLTKSASYSLVSLRLYSSWFLLPYDTVKVCKFSHVCFVGTQHFDGSPITNRSAGVAQRQRMGKRGFHGQQEALSGECADCCGYSGVEMTILAIAMLIIGAVVVLLCVTVTKKFFPSSRISFVRMTT